MLRRAGCSPLVDMRRLSIPLPCFVRTLALASALVSIGAHASTDTITSRASDRPVDVRIERQGDELVIAASARLVADPATAWAVLTDYAHYRAFIPGIRASRVVERHGTVVVVEQSDELAVWFLRMPVRVVYEIDEFPRIRLQSRASAPALPPLSSTFVLERTDTGARLDYVGHVGAGLPLLGRIEQRALQHAAIRDLEALVLEIERRGAEAHQHEPRSNGAPVRRVQ